ncbi:putative cytokinetic ring protein SteA [Bacillus sp. FJAT-45037]|uniref:putative cytokinetic ring protein SteA n=1 Tax=Bacillus sp. FJAT-45037 TaxID=2011007 RepID=UPI000C23A351|nr:putative cytokinetic ring protein SteA [Bacillus sp. FJAT-45037]
MSRVILGPVFEDIRTKKLLQYIPDNAIAFIWHEDLDTVSVNGLIERRVRAVINGSTSMTGRYDHTNVLTLLKAGIAVFDIVKMEETAIILEGEEALIVDDVLYVKKNNGFEKFASVASYNKEVIKQLQNLARASYAARFGDFLDNTLTYATREKEQFTTLQPVPRVFEQLKNQEVLIVARGGHFEKDLLYMRESFDRKMMIVAIDGAADELLKQRLKPDYIVGDMDSVSEQALKSGAILICHQYQDGTSPARERLAALGLPFDMVSLCGTSEDVAIQAAFWSGARHLYLVGCRFGMRDFLEKGRSGMASSVLTRIQAGDLITDLKGIHLLKRSRFQSAYDWWRDKENHVNQTMTHFLAEGKDWLRKKGALRHE